MNSVYHQVFSLAFAIGVLGNLVASAILGVPAFLHLHRKLNQHHREHLAIMRKAGTIDVENGGTKDALRDS